MLRIFRVLIYSCFVMAACSTTVIAVVPVGEQPENGPIHVEADRMESDQANEAVLFVGNVEARQGEMLISAERMTVNYHKSGATDDSSSRENKSIESLIATGNVELTRKDWVATGDQLEFKSEERKVVLTGNTKVWQDNNMVTGERVVLYLDEGRSVVEKNEDADKGRVKAFFYPEAEKKETNSN